MMKLTKVGTVTKKSALDIKESRLGIGFEKLDRNVFDPNKAYDKLGKIGVKWVRLQSGWARTEQEKGVYNFGWLDDVVDKLISLGMIPWICLCYGNDLYDDFAKEVFGAVGCPPIYTEEQKAAWSKYVTAIAKHFKGRVRHFEIWNEPDGVHCWKKGINGTELGNFSIATAKALKEGNEDVYVIGGAMCTASIPFWQEAFSTGMGDYLDGVSYHAYTYDERNVIHKDRSIRGLLHMHNPDIDVIQGESGSQSRADGHGAMWEGAWTPRLQAKQLLRHLTVDLLNDVKFASYFSCMDMIEALNGTSGDVASYLDYGYFGVLGAEFDENGLSVGEYTPKPSYYALQNMASLLSGKIEITDLPVLFHRETVPHLGKVQTKGGHEIIYGAFQMENGSHILTYWYPSELMTTEYEGAVSLEIAMGKEYYLVDPMCGEVYRVDDFDVDDYGTARIPFLPLRDYPLYLICGNLDYEKE